MSVNAIAAPRRRTRWKRQRGRLVAQEAFVLQPHGSLAGAKPPDNADRVPRLFEASRQLGLRPPFAKARGPFAGTTPNHGRSDQAWQISLTIVSESSMPHGGSRARCAAHHHWACFVPQCCNRRSNSEQIANVQPLITNPSVDGLATVRSSDTFAPRWHGRFVADNLPRLLGRGDLP
jgi:hypothetical protein